MFPLQQHLACLERRLNRLARMEEGTSPLEREAMDSSAGRIVPAWERIQFHVITMAMAAGFQLIRSVSSRRRASPPPISDFTTLFEQATACSGSSISSMPAGTTPPRRSAISLPAAVPVPLPAYRPFRRRRDRPELSDAATHQRRIALLLPVYRLKWCCIMLNEFLPVEGQRRTFARDAAERRGTKTRYSWKRPSGH